MAQEIFPSNKAVLYTAQLMAYALGLPASVTDLIYSMRDWRWEMVRDGFPTPSASCFEPVDDLYDPEGPPPYLWLDGAPEYRAEFDGGWRCYQKHVRRNRARIYVNDKNWWWSEVPCIELPNQNLEKLQEKLNATMAELWWQDRLCDSNL